MFNVVCKGGKEAQLESPTMDEVQSLIVKLEAYNEAVASALNSNTRSIDLCQHALSLAEQLAIDGNNEIKVKALLARLEEEKRVQEKLKVAMESRDLEQLRKALQMALDSKYCFVL
jgi:hypothetical protein